MPKAPQDLLKAARPFFTGEQETFATVLLGCLMQMYGCAVLDWDPMVVEAEVHDAFGCHMPAVVYDQLMALINALSNDSVYTSVAVFDQTINAFTRCTADHEGDIPSPEEVAWTVFELTANDPDPYEQGPDATEWPFSHDIARYVGVVLKDAGLRRKPSTLEFADIPEWSPQGLGEEPEVAAGSFQAQEELAKQVDEHVRSLFEKLSAQLQACGIKPASPFLEQSNDLPEENPLDRLIPG